MAFIANILYYRPYKPNSTGTKRGLVLGKNQYVQGGTDRASRIIGQEVAKSYSHAYTKCTHVLIYLYTERTDILTYWTFTIGRSYIFKKHSFYF